MKRLHNLVPKRHRGTVNPLSKVRFLMAIIRTIRCYMVV